MSKKEVAKETLDFWNGSAEVYKKGIEKELNDKGIKDQWVQTILENAPQKKNLRILDIGTGPGFFTIVFSKLGYDVTGIDISPEMVRVATENAAEQGVICDFKVMNANTLQFPDDTFDLIINRMVSWTLPDMYECYKEWRRVLAPNGKIILFDANHYINHFDESKAKLMRLDMRKRILNGEELTDHFDFHVRWKYWEEDIPNIGIKRPEYDRNLLLKLRFINIRINDNIFPDTFEDHGTWEPTFMVCAEKPNEDQENNFIVDEYWNAIAGAVSARAVKRMRDGSAGTVAKVFAKYIPTGSEVLDIGTGSGSIAIELSKLGYRVIGIDRAYAMIDMALLTANEYKSAVEFEVADAQDLPYHDETFDAVILRNVLWNSFHPQRMLCEASRILKKGGVMIIEDGNWQRDISEWEDSHKDRSAFPNYRKRDAGLGAYDVINEYYAKLPLNSAQRPQWDCKVIDAIGLSVVVCDTFNDPMITADLAPLEKPFLLIIRK